MGWAKGNKIIPSRGEIECSSVDLCTVWQTDWLTDWMPAIAFALQCQWCSEWLVSESGYNTGWYGAPVRQTEFLPAGENKFNRNRNQNAKAPTKTRSVAHGVPWNLWHVSSLALAYQKWLAANFLISIKGQCQFIISVVNSV